MDIKLTSKFKVADSRVKYLAAVLDLVGIADLLDTLD